MQSFGKKLVLLSIVQLVLCLFAFTRADTAGSEPKTCDHRSAGATGATKEDNVCQAATATLTNQQQLAKSSDNISSDGNVNSNCFRAAVVDYSRIDGSEDCRVGSNKNLDVYEKIGRIAKDNGVRMLVFSEDGILYGSERQVQPCLEDLPDPELTPDYNPCLQPDKFDQKFPILTRLSCLARENNLYVVANYGTKQKRDCHGGTCPPTKGSFGQYLMLNTDVVLDPTGKFLRRYRKYHPFVFTEMFAKAPQLEHVYFDTEFGRFGVFTCFDMLFKDPAIDLVEKFNIDTVVFPTYWFDEVPILPAVQYQDGWSSTNKVNLLASNILKPSTGSIGSSIFSGNRSLYVTPESDVAGQSRKTKILISTIQARRRSETADNSCSAEPNPKIIEIDDNANPQGYQKKNYKTLASDNIQALSKLKDKKTVCSGKVCCTVDYELDSSHEGNLQHIERMVVLVRDSARFGGWYEQVCTVATLTKPYVMPRAGPGVNIPFVEPTFDSEAVVSFKQLSLKAMFQTKYVFPSCAHNLTRLVERDQRHMHCEQVNNNNNGEGPAKYICDLDYLPATGSSAQDNKLYSFGMYGRIYERDPRDL